MFVLYSRYLKIRNNPNDHQQGNEWKVVYFFNGKKKNLVISAIIWMSLKNIMLNQRNQNRIVWFIPCISSSWTSKVNIWIDSGGRGAGKLGWGGLLKRSTKELSEVMEMFLIWVIVFSVCICQNSLNCILNIFVFYCV